MEKSAVTEPTHFHFFDYCLFPVTLRPSSPVHHLSWLHSWPSSHWPNIHTGCPGGISNASDPKLNTLRFSPKLLLLLCPCLHHHPKSHEWRNLRVVCDSSFSFIFHSQSFTKSCKHHLWKTQFQSGLCDTGSFVKHLKRKNPKTEKHRLECFTVRKTSAFFVFFAFTFQNFYKAPVILLKLENFKTYSIIFLPKVCVHTTVRTSYIAISRVVMCRKNLPVGTVLCQASVVRLPSGSAGTATLSALC